MLSSWGGLTSDCRGGGGQGEDAEDAGQLHVCCVVGFEDGKVD